MATYEQNNKFTKDVVPNNLLDEAIDWIVNNLTVSDVFDDEAILAYATDTASVSDVFTDDVVIEYVQTEMDPEDVFSADDLAAWADNNGYVLQ